MAPTEKAFAASLRACTFHAGHTTVVSSVTGAVFDPARAARLLGRQISSPVDWVSAVRTMRQAGVTHFDEINGSTLTALIQGIR
jgi:malonyl CoA-acyl carrier protein transacylase